MSIELMRGSDLGPQDLEIWRQLQKDHPALDRPFFSPEYASILGEVRSDVEIAVLHCNGRTAGFFPFQRVRPRVARAVGSRLCDFEGFVAAPEFTVEAQALLTACRLDAWYFEHLLVTQPALGEFLVAQRGSAYVDLRRGFDAYLAERRAAGAGWVTQVPRKARKLGREVGELRFEYDTRDPQVLRRVLDWKSLQRQRTKTDDMLKRDWVKEALQRMLVTHEEGFAGVLSALFAGPHLVAGHFGLRSRRTLHVWFPAFDLRFEKYSPGLVMFLELFRAAAQAGIERVDLGIGDERYKLSLGSATVSVAEGCIDRRPVPRLWHRAWRTGWARLRGSELAATLQGPKRFVRRIAARVSPGD